MRILFTALGAYGHVYPLIPLARAARTAGHEVTFATSAAFTEQVRSFDLTPARVGIGILDAFTSLLGGADPGAAELHGRLPQLQGQVFGEVLPRAYLGDLTPLLARYRPDLVVWEHANPGGFLAALQAGIPSVGHGIGRLDAMAQMAETMILPLAGVAAEAGVELPRGSGATEPLLDIYPPSLQGDAATRPPNRIPMRPVPVDPPGELPEWLGERERGRPLIYLTIGTAFGAMASTAQVLNRAAHGAAALDADVLVVTGPSLPPDSLGALPERVRLRSWVPQARLLPMVDLIVHHGGSGTTLAAFAAGVPQLVVPLGADQFGNADAVVATGAGVQLDAATLTAAQVTEAAAALLEDAAIRRRTAEIAAEIAAMPSPEQIVGVLEATASR